MAALPDDDTLAEVIDDILAEIDFDTTSLRAVMKMISDRVNLTPAQLAPKKRFVRKVIDVHLRKYYENEDESNSADRSNDPAEAPSAPGSRLQVQQRQQQQQLQQQQLKQSKQSKRSKQLKQPKQEQQHHQPRRDHHDLEGTTTDDVESADIPDKPTAVRKRAKRKKSPDEPVRLSSLERAVVPTAPLAAFLGTRVMPRSQITKRISAYVRENKLKTVEGDVDKRYVCDDTLKTALGVDNFTYYELSRLMSGLVRKPSECGKELEKLAKQCDERTLHDKRAGTSLPGKKSRVAKGEANERRGSGLQRPMKLSPELTAVCGGEEMLPRGGVVKKIWCYIRENSLKDKDDPMKIRCDEKLKAVFDGREYIVAMDVNKYIGGHMTKIL